MRRSSVRVLPTLAFIASVATAFPEPLSAHQTLRHSQPARGSTLASPPRVLRLTFVEPVNLALTRLVLLGPGGDTVALGARRLHSDSATVLIAEVEGSQRPGAYRLEWRTVGRDGHVVDGTIAYSVERGDARLQAPVPDTPAVETALPPIATPDFGPPAIATAEKARGDPELAGGAGPIAMAAQWIRLLALLLVIGSTSASILLLRDRRSRRDNGGRARDREPEGEGEGEGEGMREAAGPVAPSGQHASQEIHDALAPAGAPAGSSGQGRPSAAATHFLSGAPARAAAIGLAAALVVLLGALVRLRLQMADVAAVAPDATGADRATLILRSFWGVGWVLELAGALAATAAFLLVRRTGRGWWLAVTGAFVLAASAAASGHSAAGDLPALTMPLDALHVLGAAGWLGTLAILVVIAIPALLRIPEAERGGSALQLFRAFSPFALTCAAVVVATGVAAAAIHLGSFGALWQTTYGRTLLVKVGVVVVLAALGAWNWQRATPRLTRDPRGVEGLRRSASAEVAVAALIVLVTAALIATPLPRP